MSDVARRFWLLVLPTLAGFSAAGLLVLSFFFPEPLFAVDSAGYLVTAAVAAASLGLLVWQVATGDRRALGGIDGAGRH